MKKPQVIVLATLLVILIVGLSFYPLRAGALVRYPSRRVAQLSGAHDGVTDAAPTAADVALGTTLFQTIGKLDYVAAGAGIRNTGHGTISLRVPVGATVVKAFMFWGVIRNSTFAGENKATLNGELVTGTLICTNVSPCWVPTTIATYWADVTSVFTRTSGPVDTHEVGGFVSSNRNGQDPWWNSAPNTATNPTSQTPPMLDGVSLVVIFTSSNLPTRYLLLIAGCYTAIGGVLTLTVNHAAHTLGNPVETTAFVLDGQVALLATPTGKSYAVNAVTLQSDTLRGVDPSLTSYATVKGSLSDTLTFYDLDTIIGAAAVSHTVTVNGDGDCLTWVYYVYVG